MPKFIVTVERVRTITQLLTYEVEQDTLPQIEDLSYLEPIEIEDYDDEVSVGCINDIDEI